MNLNNFCFSDVENFDNIDRVTNNTPMDVSSTYSNETLIYGYDCDSEGNTFDDDDDISSGIDEISSGSSNISRSGSSTDIYEDECYNPLTYIHEGLSFLYTNADNLINKMDELRARVVVMNPDIIIITEVYPKTCDSTKILPVELDITGYICFRSNVMKSSRGVVIYVKDIISAERRNNLSDSNFLESVWVDVNINKQDKILIGGIYRSPNSEHDNTQILFDLINRASQEKCKHKIIVGDFNFPEIDWYNWMTSTNENHNSFRFLECLRDNYLEQFVNQPTRWRDLEPGNVLDLVLADSVDLINNLEITTRIGKSDHLCIEFGLDTSVDACYKGIHTKNYYRGNYIQAAEDLAKVNWNIMNEMNVIESWNYFYSNVRQVIDSCIPETQYKKKVRPVWMDMYCKKLIEDKFRAWKKYTYSNKREDYEKYRKIRNKIPKCVRHARRKYKKGIARDVNSNPKAFWKYVHSKSHVKSGIGNLKDNCGNNVTDDRSKADILNNFFSSVFTKETGELPPFDVQVDNDICDVIVNVQKVRELLKSVNTSKSTGPDEIHPRFLKELADHLAYPITILFNNSLSEGSLPPIWKSANVSCIFKSGDKKSASNYRPISITPVICRLLERIIRNAVMSHCIDNNIFSDSQYCFRNRRGCTLQLLKVLDDWTKAIDNGLPVDTLYLDLQKAFDSVPHQRLILKLERLGITGNLLRWIKNFLSERKQRVVLNGISSDWTDVISGVPQGSVLGQILFILYVNDLPDKVKSYCKIFADDTKLYKEINNLKDYEDLQDDIYELCRWTTKWLLFFNANKCKVLLIGNNNPRFDYEMTDKNYNKVNIKVVDHEKDLGVIFQENLKFDLHISFVVNKANRILGLIKRSFVFMDKSTFLCLYKSLVRSHLDYGDLIWFPVLKKHIRMIENVQRRATRILSTLRHLSYSERLQELNLPTLLYRRRRADLIQVFKIIKGFDDIPIEDFFQISESTTRGHSHKIFKPRSQKSIRQNSFSVRIVEDWNSLPEEVVSVKTVLQFKTRLDKMWIHRRFDDSEIY